MLWEPLDRDLDDPLEPELPDLEPEPELELDYNAFFFTKFGVTGTGIPDLTISNFAFLSSIIYLKST